MAGVGFGLVARRLTVRLALALIAACMAGGTTVMLAIDSPALGYAAAVLYGVGVGGLITILPIAWADYFGRRSFGAIRGAALSVQVTAQAAGPLLSGALRDWTGDYMLSLECFMALAVAGIGVALLTRAPRR